MEGKEDVFIELLQAGAKVDQNVFHYFCAHFCSTNCEGLLTKILETGLDINSSFGLKGFTMLPEVLNI